MKIFQLPGLSEQILCPYLPDRESIYQYFFASDLTEGELNGLLESGWRKFGYYYFRPACENCTECIPIRVLVDTFTQSKNQKSVYKRGQNIRVKFNELQYSDEIFEIYQDHSLTRFGNEAIKDEFILNFYFKSCPSLQSEYYLDDRLIAVGYLDKTQEALSSVYFIYRTEYGRLSMGTFSILKEIEYSKSLQLKYYYLGYYLEKNHFMVYKNRFKPNEKYNWSLKKWLPSK